ncbi:MAG: hypothetical protein K6E28_02770 [Eubacterium sp.]|nr:hypothetical protein [Eubacterium sp.]
MAKPKLTRAEKKAEKKKLKIENKTMKKMLKKQNSEMTFSILAILITIAIIALDRILDAKAEKNDSDF